MSAMGEKIIGALLQNDSNSQTNQKSRWPILMITVQYWTQNNKILSTHRSHY